MVKNKFLPLLLAASLSGLLAGPLGAAELKGSQAKKILKEADAAAAGGNGVKARELYQLVLAGTLKTPARRADALYKLALLEAGEKAADRDAALLEKSLAEFLKEFPRDERKPIVAALATLHQEVAARQTEIAGLEARVAEAQAQLAAHAESAVTSSKDATHKVEELEAKTRRQQAEIERLKAELAKQDEALKKLKKVVVGGG